MSLSSKFGFNSSFKLDTHSDYDREGIFRGKITQIFKRAAYIITTNYPIFVISSIITTLSILAILSHKNESVQLVVDQQLGKPVTLTPSVKGAFQESSASSFASSGNVIVTLQPVSRKINLNKATKLDLESLPYVGPVLAQRIIDYRQKNGNFANTHALVNVKGIGEKTYTKLKDLITVDD